MNSDMVKDFKPDQQRADRVVKALKMVSDQIGRSQAQVALAWLRYRPVPVIPIIGARKFAQFQDNMASLEVALSPEQVKSLDEASSIDLGFPYSHVLEGTRPRHRLRRPPRPNPRLTSFVHGDSRRAFFSGASIAARHFSLTQTRTRRSRLVRHKSVRW